MRGSRPCFGGNPLYPYKALPYLKTRAALLPITTKYTRAMANETGGDDHLLRCPCESGQDLPQSLDSKNAWIQCDGCTAWQHNICVGNLEVAMPEDYFCEECKPEHHKRFEFGSGSDNRAAIAKERQEMCALHRTREEDAMKKKTQWLVSEVMAVVEEHPGVLDELGTGTEDKARLSIRIVLFNASVSALERFRARVVRVRFGEKEAVAAELKGLRAWLSPAFMKKLGNVEETERLEKSFEVEGLDGMGQAHVTAVKKFFNMDQE
jgi:hypothetical protein